MTMTTAILLVLLIAAALWTVMTFNLIMSAIGLAITSAILAIILFLQGAPLAAVLELSVCAGLITVVFVSAISLTPRIAREEKRTEMRRRLARFIPLPMIVAAAAWLLWGRMAGFALPVEAMPAEAADVRDILWNGRSLDLLGQIVIILTGVFAIVVLFKNLKQAGGRKP